MTTQRTDETRPADGAAMTRREAIRRATLALGAALSPSVLAGLARAQPAAPGGGARYLEAGAFATAAAAAERILPRTETPGAGDVGVPGFIDLMAGEYLTPAEKTLLLGGLAELDAAARAAHGRAFAALPAAAQDEVLGRIARTAEMRKEKTGFHVLRELTIAGYFTSETVGRTVTHYDPVPGEYRGCIPLSEVGNRAWTR